jgi:hypothetical protein
MIQEKTKTVKISKDFSRSPGGRYVTDGRFSGEEFRDNVLIPILKETDKIIVDLDGCFGFGSSFLEEAFGGLLRKGFDASVYKDRISIVSAEDPSYLEEIQEYIDEEAARQSQSK